MFTGVCCSTLFAQLSGADKASVSVGLFGFNGAYVGLGLAYYWPPWSWDTVVATTILAAFSSMPQLCLLFLTFSRPDPKIVVLSIALYEV